MRGRFTLSLEDELGHTGKFLFADDPVFQEIPVEIVQPYFLGHAPFSLACGHCVLHSVISFLFVIVCNRNEDYSQAKEKHPWMRENPVFLCYIGVGLAILTLMPRKLLRLS